METASPLWPPRCHIQQGPTLAHAKWTDRVNTTVFLQYCVYNLLLPTLLFSGWRTSLHTIWREQWLALLTTVRRPSHWSVPSWGHRMKATWISLCRLLYLQGYVPTCCWLLLALLISPSSGWEQWVTSTQLLDYQVPSEAIPTSTVSSPHSYCCANLHWLQPGAHSPHHSARVYWSTWSERPRWILPKAATTARWLYSWAIWWLPRRFWAGNEWWLPP